jgi:aminoglycoside phosphotransferase (APT) family kinase protein
MSASPATPGLDRATLESYLHRSAPGTLTGPLTAQLVAGGKSNLTYVLGDGRSQWVLRRPPLGHVLETAHDMAREYRVMAALDGTDVPVPQMVTLCTDPEVLGAPFYVMSFVEGTIHRTEEQLAEVSPAAAERLADDLVDVLARLHAIDPAAVGLGDLGRPEGYLERQVRRWGKQLASSRSREVPGLDALGARLAEAVPVSHRSGLVHGDYKLDNVVVAPTGIVAVLDWEMATLGDPLMDLVNVVGWWDGIRDTEGTPTSAAPSDQAAFPPSTRLLDRYAAATGADLDALPWYTGLFCYKLAAIFEGIYFRETQGMTVGEGFDELAGLGPALASRGHEALDGFPVGKA